MTFYLLAAPAKVTQFPSKIYYVRTLSAREYELITEAHAKLSVVRNWSRSSHHVCLGEGKQLASGGYSAVAGGGGGRQYTGRENLEQFRTTES
jgi:hypothetical protein